MTDPDPIRYAVTDVGMIFVKMLGVVLLLILVAGALVAIMGVWLFIHGGTMSR
ncbi:hypothetical protein ACIQWR_07045 [Streptomyces sp. NPDC098789]|uniref:hypothetical protein n=1 Tax=Streptomyces sp. NPDC098789 TaxID=3366098 RepID=UPI00382D136C